MSSSSVLRLLALIAAVVWGGANVPANAANKPLKILWLGDNGHHQPFKRFEQLKPVLAARYIDLEYTDKPADLNTAKLGGYQGLIVYANIDSITNDQEQALLEYVNAGHGFIPLHCASFCFRNSKAYVDLVGAQFQRHGTGIFRTKLADDAQLDLLDGFQGFESWDETYVHTQHNPKDRTVLEYREDQEGREPWTWVRTQGEGRVFYTAWGHDERTFSNPGFQNLVERGIRWAVKSDTSVVPRFTDQPQMTKLSKDVAPFEFVPANVPFYPAGEKWGTIGKPITEMQKPLPPSESIKHYVTPVGFHLELYASEPELAGKPIAMNWDDRGRLWIAETLDYPNEMQKSGEGRDRIRICEDTDGDGKADKFTVFADKLSIPTSLLCVHGGVIVHQAPDTLFIRDTNGDDVADERYPLFTGWSVSDTHAGPSNLRLGLDNWIYGIVGYAGFEGEIAGERQSFRTGFYRFQVKQNDAGKVAVTKFEFLRNTNNNSWGVGISEEGVLFGSTANDNPSVYMPVANRFYESVRGWSSGVLGTIADDSKYHPITEKVRQVDHHGKFTAAAGHALYTARTYPAEYWNRTAFVTGPDGHLAATFAIHNRGSDYRSKNSWNLVAADDEWAAPIMAEVGPDGQVWILDWYNYIVQHNPTPQGFKTGKGAAYETDLRDKKHGRIYRVIYDKGTPSPQPKLHEADVATLVAALENPNMFWRLQAQRLLVEREGTDAVPSLVTLASKQELDAVGLCPGAMHALWTLHGLGAINDKTPDALSAAKAALGHRSPGVRRAAILVLPPTEDSVIAIRESGIQNDSDGQVRLQTALALAEMPDSMAAAELVVSMLSQAENTEQRWIVDALTSAAARHDKHFLTVLTRTGGINGGRLPPNNPVVLNLLGIVAEHCARNKPGDEMHAILGNLPRSRADLSAALIAGWSKGWPADHKLKLSKADENSLALLFRAVPAASRSQLIRLAERWGSTSLRSQAAEIAAAFLADAQNAEKSDADRSKAAAEYIELSGGSVEAADELLSLLTPQSSPDFVQGLFAALGRSDAAEVGQNLVETLPSLTPSAKQAAVKTLLARSAWTEALLHGVEKGRLLLNDLTLDQKQSLANHPDKKVAGLAKTVLERGGALPNADREKVLQELLPLTKQKGDPLLGKAIFVKQCAKCHKHGSEGTQIGPELTGMAVHPKGELLMNIIDPSRSVEGNFRLYTVLTASGRTVSGMLASENKTAIELFDTEAKKQVVLREDIDELKASNKSLMPEGFEKQIKPEEIVHLLEFLTQKGKYVTLPLDKVATISSVRGMFITAEADVERLIFPDWNPKTFEGVPFNLIDPQDGKRANAVLLYAPQGTFPPQMPKSVTLPCNASVKTIHMLGGVSGWGFPYGEKDTLTMIVRLKYADGETEDHEMRNGQEFADYIRRVDVPNSKFAFALRGQQIRYLTVNPKRTEPLESIELVKGPDRCAPVVMAVTIETAQ